MCYKDYGHFFRDCSVLNNEAGTVFNYESVSIRNTAQRIGLSLGLLTRRLPDNDSDNHNADVKAV